MPTEDEIAADVLGVLKRARVPMTCAEIVKRCRTTTQIIQVDKAARVLLQRKQVQFRRAFNGLAYEWVSDEPSAVAATPPAPKRKPPTVKAKDGLWSQIRLVLSRANAPMTAVEIGEELGEPMPRVYPAIGQMAKDPNKVLFELRAGERVREYALPGTAAAATLGAQRAAKPEPTDTSRPESTNWGVPSSSLVDSAEDANAGATHGAPDQPEERADAEGETPVPDPGDGDVGQDGAPAEEPTGPAEPTGEAEPAEAVEPGTCRVVVSLTLELAAAIESLQTSPNRTSALAAELSTMHLLEQLLGERRDLHTDTELRRIATWFHSRMLDVSFERGRERLSGRGKAA